MHEKTCSDELLLGSFGESAALAGDTMPATLPSQKGLAQCSKPCICIWGMRDEWLTTSATYAGRKAQHQQGEGGCVGWCKRTRAHMHTHAQAHTHAHTHTRTHLASSSSDIAMVPARSEMPHRAATSRTQLSRSVTLRACASASALRLACCCMSLSHALLMDAMLLSRPCTCMHALLCMRACVRACAVV